VGFERSHGRGGGPPNPKAPELEPETPEQQFRGHLHRAARDVQTAIGKVDAMTSEKNPSQWDDAKATATKAIASAEKELAAARANEGAIPDGAVKVAEAQTAIDDAKQKLTTAGERPDGIDRVALEDDLIAIHRRAVAGDRGDLGLREWAQHLNDEVKAIVARLAPEDWDRLKRRMSSPLPTDKLAAWLATRSVRADIDSRARDGKARARQYARLAEQAAGAEALDGGATRPAALTVSIDALSFGTVRIGEESAPQSIVVANAGTEPVDIEDVALHPPAAAAVFPTYGALAGPLAPGDAVDLRFAFRPAQEGGQSARHHVITDGGVTSAQIHVDGVAVPATFDTSPLSSRASISNETASQLDASELDEQALATRRSIAGPDHAGADNLETLGWAAFQRGEELPAPPPGAGQVVADGITFSNDPAHMRYVLETVISQRGLKGAAYLILHLAQTEIERDQAAGASLDLSTRIAAAKRPQGIPALAGNIFAELNAEADAFLSTFETTANQEILRSLAQSEGTVHGTIAQYGLTWNDLFESLLAPQINDEAGSPVHLEETALAAVRMLLGERPELHVGNNAQLGSLVTAARTLQASEQDVQRKEAARDQTAAQLTHDPRYGEALEHYLGHALDDDDFDSQVDEGLPDENMHRAEAMLADDLRAAATGDPQAAEALPSVVDPGLVNATEEASAANEEHGLLGVGLEAQHPILAAFRGGLGSLTGNDDAVAQQIAIKSIETLANIKKVRSGLERGKYKVWDLPRIIDATRTRLQVVPGSWRDRVLFDRVEQEHNDEAWLNLALTILAVGLSVVAAIPTGGSSLAAGAAVVADVAAVGLDLYMATDAIRAHSFQQAAARSALDPYQAIADREPALADLVMSVAAAGLGLNSAVSLIRRARVLRQLVTRALEGDAEALARARVVRDDLNLTASQSGISSPLGDQVVAQAAGGGGTLDDIAAGQPGSALSTPEQRGRDILDEFAERQERHGEDQGWSGMHDVDLEDDLRQRTHERASVRGGDASKSPRSPMALHIPPGGPEFERWFDGLTLKELDELLNDPSAKLVIADNIRHPGELHEWIMVKHARKAKEWGVSMETVRSARTSTAETVGRYFRHGGEGSGTMHDQLDEMIVFARSFDDFKARLNTWADRELFPVPGTTWNDPRHLGRYYLPPELQIPLDGGTR